MTIYLVYSFYSKPNQAKKIAKLAIKKKLAACVNIIPIEQSVYLWNGKLESESEFQLMIKTDIEYKSSLEKLIKYNHPYELPEIIVINIDDGSNEYLNWIKNNLSIKDIDN